MNYMIEEKISMFFAVKQLFAESREIWSDNKAIRASLLLFEEKISTICDLRNSNLPDQRIVTSDKNGKKELLVKKAFYLASCLMSFSAATSDEMLYEKTKWSETRLKRLRDRELSPVCQSLYEQSGQNLSYIEQYGINRKFLEDIKFTITSFNESLDSSHKILSERKELNLKLKLLVHEAITLLYKRLDHDMVYYKLIFPGFYRNYSNSRRIIRLAGHETYLTGTVKETRRGNLLSNVSVTIPELNLKTRSSPKGRFRFRNLPQGRHCLSFHKSGCKPKKETIDISTGKKLLVEINLDII